MATHRSDVYVRFGVPGAVESATDSAEISLVRVPDVRLQAEAAAIATIVRAGLVPGQRSPRPRPASGRPEVVMRSRPGAGALVRRGTRVDYELLPGQSEDRAAIAVDASAPRSVAILGMPRPGRPRPAAGRPRPVGGHA